MKVKIKLLCEGYSYTYKPVTGLVVEAREDKGKAGHLLYVVTEAELRSKGGSINKKVDPDQEWNFLESEVEVLEVCE